MTEARATIAYVPLRLEETGMLHHMIAEKFHDMRIDPSLPIRPQLMIHPASQTSFATETEAIVLERLRSLMLRLGGHSDRLMGKV